MPFLRTCESRMVSLCASEMGVGISSAFSFTGIAKHHSLVAGAAGVYAHGDVAGLFVDGGDDGAGVGVEAVEGVVVSDGGDVPRTTDWKSTYALVVISPAMTTRPVAVRVSQATRLVVSSARQASRIASEIWSAILSGWPSVTDSEVNK